jgi:hypothetical protein
VFQWFRRQRQLPTLAPGDLRSAVRHPCDRKKNEHLVAAVGIAAWPALVRDISTRGIALVVGQRHEPGTRLALRLENTRSSVICPVELEVVHTVRRPDGYWLTGGTFASRLREEELEALL